jgi:maleamate amidohydrolase
MDDFENHCWKDIVPADVLDIYTHYARKTLVGSAPAWLAIDLYELVYQGGAMPVAELHRTFPSSCGENVHAATEPTKRLFAAARSAAIPAFCTTQDTWPDSLPTRINATKRQRPSRSPADYGTKSEFKLQAGDGVIAKQHASVFYGKPLLAHLTQLGIQTVIVFGESTSGRVRASAVDAHFQRLSCRRARRVLLRPQHPFAPGKSVRHASQVH